MKALSVRQPWASQIAGGQKTEEHRNWETSYRGPLLICAGKTWEADEPKPEGWRESHPLGGALCVVDLVDITRSDSAYWAFDWHLENPRPVRPVAVKGQLGLFTVPDGLVKLSPAPKTTRRPAARRVSGKFSF